MSDERSRLIIPNRIMLSVKGSPHLESTEKTLPIGLSLFIN